MALTADSDSTNLPSTMDYVVEKRGLFIKKHVMSLLPGVNYSASSHNVDAIHHRAQHLQLDSQFMLYLFLDRTLEEAQRQTLKDIGALPPWRGLYLEL